jgi:hypothetical protein
MAALIIGLLIGAAATYFLAVPGLSRTTRATSVTTATTTLPVESISATTVTSTRTSTTNEVTGANASTVASNGLELSTSINATELAVGQVLDVSISLANTLPTPSSLQQGGKAGFLPGNWTVYGVPVATWRECTLDVFPFGWQYPIDVLVLSGNYTVQQLSSLANVSLSAGPCGAGAGASAIPTYTFEPNSDLINITYFGSGGGHGALGVWPASTHLMVGGYWNLTSLQQTASDNFSNPDYAYDYCITAVLLACEVPASIPFVPGVYTIAVSDEWGQFDVLRVQIGGGSG